MPTIGASFICDVRGQLPISTSSVTSGRLAAGLNFAGIAAVPDRDAANSRLLLEADDQYPRRRPRRT
jgi:hypothetical protein